MIHRGATQGTCYSSTECSDKNGMASGNCASGYVNLYQSKYYVECLSISKAILVRMIKTFFFLSHRFGVCCVFLNTGAATATISENRTRLRNAEFPSIATATTAQTIVYTINKMNAGTFEIIQIKFYLSRLNK